MTRVGHGAADYQWQRNGVDIPGATAASYTLANASDRPTTAPRSGRVVTNAFGSATSNTATLP